MRVNLLKALFCRHKDLKFWDNVYGDRITHLSTSKETCRSLWECQKCGMLVKRPYLAIETERK
jgi:hypothetical protein